MKKKMHLTQPAESVKVRPKSSTAMWQTLDEDREVGQLRAADLQGHLDGTYM